MEPLGAALLVALMTLPFHWLVRRQLDKLVEPEHLRRRGVVIVRSEALQAHSKAIGVYRGVPIWGSVTFMGMRYRFHHVTERERAGPRELYLRPGLVYLTD
jgi:hypothetical protein